MSFTAMAELVFFALITSAWAQSIGLTEYPQQVVTGQTYTIAWESSDQPATITLVRGGRVEATLLASDGTASSFRWTVEDDYSGGTDYSLTFSSGDVSQATNLDIIEDEDGLVISGTTVTTPRPTSMLTATTALSSVASASPAVTSSTFVTLSPAASATSATPAISTTSATSSTSIAPATPANNKRGLSDGAIAGIVIGVLALATLSGTAVWFYLRRKAPSPKHIDPDPIRSFLDLGRNNRTSGTIKGTSPEVAAIPPVSPAWIHRKPVGISELSGEPVISRGGLREHIQPGLMTRIFEVNRKPARYEMPSGTV